jgi:GNAT superfamily N-acetyltransferase
MQLPVMTPELARRIEQNDIDYSISRLGGMRQAEGNPLKIDIKQFGSATAFLIQALYLCIAHVNATPAGVAILFVKDGIGLFADAATLPIFRGKGCHAALIHHQVAQAAKRDCDLLTSFVEFGSVSHRNHERAGFRVAYTKALWWMSE